MVKTLWFVYSAGVNNLDSAEPLNSPYTIFWHIGRMLRAQAAQRGYEFQYINLDTTPELETTAQDIAIGHTWYPDGAMNRLLNAPIARKIVLQPFSHGMVGANEVEWQRTLFRQADALLSITGRYWFDTMSESPYAEFTDKATRVDMAINLDKYPFLKTTWGKRGRRAAVCIGNDTPAKGFQYVADLARMAGFRLGHFGSVNGRTFDHVPQCTLHGGRIFDEHALKEVAQYDALFHMGVMDANPTILLEASAIGLPVYCTQQSGYFAHVPFEPLYLDDHRKNLSQVRHWQWADDYDLIQLAAEQRKIVELDHTWDIFKGKVEAAVWQTS